MDDENALRGKLFAAAWRGDFDSVKEIIETKRLDINTTDSDGVSALRFSSQYGHLEMTKYLLDQGANIHQVAADQFDPLLSAVDYGQEEIVALLISRGANVRRRTRQTNAVLLAKEKGHLSIEKMLKEAGATDTMGLWFNVKHRTRKFFSLKG